MSRQKIIFPNGLECYYLSSKEETEFIFSEIFTEEQYLRNGIVLKEGDCIFDVGANIGLFSLFVSRLQEKLKIYAFEPIQEIFEVLQENVRLHSLHNMFLYNYGLSSETNPKKLWLFSNQYAKLTIKLPIKQTSNSEVFKISKPVGRAFNQLKLIVDTFDNTTRSLMIEVSNNLI